MAFKVFGYGRVSTDHQGVSIEQQRLNVEDAFALYKRVKPDWAEAEWGGWFQDVGVSRTTKFREREAGRLVFDGSVRGDVILVNNFDRMFASALDVCETLEIIKERGVRLSILDFPIPIDTDLGEACFQIIALIKNIEVKAIRSRTKLALEHRRNVGLPVGKPPAGWRTVRMRVDGGIRSFYVKDWGQRKLADKMLIKQAELRLSNQMFFSWCKHAGWLDADGREWSEHTFLRFLRAAKRGFPLPNGKLDAAPIPATARPTETLDE
jgi:DNA invertase Pin-like site-specific DNA recombinase